MGKTFDDATIISVAKWIQSHLFYQKEFLDDANDAIPGFLSQARKASYAEWDVIADRVETWIETWEEAFEELESAVEAFSESDVRHEQIDLARSAEERYQFVNHLSHKKLSLYSMNDFFNFKKSAIKTAAERFDTALESLTAEGWKSEEIDEIGGLLRNMTKKDKLNAMGQYMFLLAPGTNSIFKVEEWKRCMLALNSIQNSQA